MKTNFTEELIVATEASLASALNIEYDPNNELTQYCRSWKAAGPLIGAHNLNVVFDGGLVWAESATVRGNKVNMESTTDVDLIVRYALTTAALFTIGREELKKSGQLG